MGPNIGVGTKHTLFTWWARSWAASLCSLAALLLTIYSVLRCDFLPLIIPKDEKLSFNTTGVFCFVDSSTTDQLYYVPKWLAASPSNDHVYINEDVVPPGSDIHALISRIFAGLSIATGTACVFLTWSLTLILPTSCITTRNSTAVAILAAFAASFGVFVFLIHQFSLCVEAKTAKLQGGKCGFGAASWMLVGGVGMWIVTFGVAFFTGELDHSTMSRPINNEDEQFSQKSDSEPGTIPIPQVCSSPASINKNYLPRKYSGLVGSEILQSDRDLDGFGDISTNSLNYSLDEADEKEKNDILSQKSN
uniref:Uncharacterized protein n=1 Tax=Corethron hystrix TaxID=216773 RepID=A0A7S1B3X0_9STRA|mmetsp:Transcript_11498/g.25199  ORF Transcript_11498/g.25199 Transcript_11498/m.25199 type:complete len:306 (+) Transcript_11498:32-949(+)